MTKKDLAYYMRLPYRVVVYPEPDGTGYTAVVPDLPGCLTCAGTWEELGAMVEDAKRAWIAVALEDGDHVPEPGQAL